MAVTTWVVVLVKDFDSAKQRLRPAMGIKSRRALARRNAQLAVRAAAAGDQVFVVAGSEEVADFARALGAAVFVEPRQEGQNPAAQRGIQHALAHGAGAVLLLSSDLPLVTEAAVRKLLDSAARLKPPIAIAVPAIGRGGTNALYLRPPGAIAMHFGDDSLARFRAEAEAKGVRFAVHHSDPLALDLDEPSDLARLSRAV